MGIQTVTASSLTDTRELRELFVGRTKELMWVQQALTRNRLVAITGPYGSGKTALAVIAAEKLKPQFPGGVEIVRAGPHLRLTDLVAAAFPVTPRQSSLLILDEYEQIRRRAGRPIERLLSDRGWLSILLVGTTSAHLTSIPHVDLGAFSHDEAMDFAQRVSEKLGRSIPLSELARIVDVTQNLPRLLARALELVVNDNLPVTEVVEQLRGFWHSGLVGLDGKPLSSKAPARGRIIENVKSVNSCLLEMAKADPVAMRNMPARDFEELIAELLSRQGFYVELTPPTKDGGFDMFAAQHTALGKFLFLVECKRYSETNRVGVEIVRALHGVVQQHKATAGIIATTSFFTSGAESFQRTVKHQMSLRDYVDVQTWISNVMQ
jgi:restriction system protein